MGSIFYAPLMHQLVLSHDGFMLRKPDMEIKRKHNFYASKKCAEVKTSY